MSTIVRTISAPSSLSTASKAVVHNIPRRYLSTPSTQIQNVANLAFHAMQKENGALKAQIAEKDDALKKKDEQIAQLAKMIKDIGSYAPCGPWCGISMSYTKRAVQTAEDILTK